MKSLIVVVVLTTTAIAHADDLYAGAGWDTAPVAKARYEHVFGWVAMPIELTLPVIRPGGGEIELRAGARHRFQLSERWRVDTTLAGFLRTTSDPIADIVGLGLDAEVVPAFDFGRGAVGLELGYDQSLADHITNSDAYKADYMGAVDGWYGVSQATPRAGVRASLRLGPGELRLRGGVTPELIPFYAELGFATRL